MGLQVILDGIHRIAIAAIKSVHGGIGVGHHQGRHTGHMRCGGRCTTKAIGASRQIAEIAVN